MTAVMGVWATRTLVMVWGTPSSRTRKLLALRPGTKRLRVLASRHRLGVNDVVASMRRE
jgi:hypothetical protein